MEASVQAVLAQQGYYQGPIDGNIGPSTSRAIRNYQSDHRLTPTGTINPALANSMGLAAPAPSGFSASSAYYPSYAPATYYTSPAVIGAGGGWPVAGCGSYWNRGGYGGYNGWGYGGRYPGNYNGNGYWNQGNNDHGNNDKNHNKHGNDDHKDHGDKDHKHHDHKKHGNHD